MYSINDHAIRITASAFGGSERKQTVILDDGNIYMMKMPDPIREAHRNVSYINNTISEYLGCKIYKELGVPVQDVILGDYRTTSSNGVPKTYIACLCKNLATDGYILAPAELTALSSTADKKIVYLPGFHSLDAISESVNEIDKNDIYKFYAEMFVVDAFLGNTDRHNGNWGFLIGPADTKISPVYDCGSCLCPLIAESEMNQRTAVREALNGMSALLDEGKRIEYRSYLSSGKNEYVNKALKSITPRINMNNILEIINNTEYISKERKCFYSDFLKAKYERILIPALESILDRNISHSGRVDYSVENRSIYVQIRDELEKIRLFENKSGYIGNLNINIIHAAKNHYILANPETNEAEAVISLRSNQVNAWKLIETLSQTYNLELADIGISVDGEPDDFSQSEEMDNDPNVSTPGNSSIYMSYDYDYDR